MSRINGTCQVIHSVYGTLSPSATVTNILYVVYLGLWLFLVGFLLFSSLCLSLSVFFFLNFWKVPIWSVLWKWLWKLFCGMNMGNSKFLSSDHLEKWSCGSTRFWSNEIGLLVVFQFLFLEIHVVLGNTWNITELWIFEFYILKRTKNVLPVCR